MSNDGARRRPDDLIVEEPLTIQLDGTVVRLRSKRDHQIEIVVLQVVEALRAVLRQIEAHLVQNGDGEGVDAGRPHTSRIDEDPAAMQMLHQRLGDRRADGIVGAGEEDAAGQLPVDISHECEGHRSG